LERFIVDDNLFEQEPEEIEYYICGPQLMTNAVIKMLESLGVPSGNILFDDFGN
jgi:Na+-transporting NADH:ubiquinone oxidoreductase subunit F